MEAVVGNAVLKNYESEKQVWGDVTDNEMTDNDFDDDKKLPSTPFKGQG